MNVDLAQVSCAQPYVATATRVTLHFKVTCPVLPCLVTDQLPATSWVSLVVAIGIGLDLWNAGLVTQPLWTVSGRLVSLVIQPLTT